LKIQLPRRARRVHSRERRQAITYQVDSALERAKKAIAINDFAGAQAAIESARVARGTDPIIFTRDDINGFDTRIASAQADLPSRLKLETAAAPSTSPAC